MAMTSNRTPLTPKGGHRAVHLARQRLPAYRQACALLAPLAVSITEKSPHNSF
jgi:hypothetical protein